MTSRTTISLAVLALASAAFAQTTQTTPPTGAPAAAKAGTDAYQAVLARDGVELRCGAGTFYYPITLLKSGTVVKVLGEESGWLKVAYPEGLRVIIAAEDVAADASGKTVKLTKDGRLRHMNLNGGATAAWGPVVLDAAPAPGTEFAVLDSTKRADGTISHYAVAAPGGAYGFINRDLARKLTAEEIAAAAAKPAVVTPPTPAPTDPATPATPSGETPAATPPAPNPPAAPANPEINPAAAPVTPPAPPAPKVDPRIAETAALAAMFKRVQSQGPAEAEFDQAILAFNDAIAKAGTGPADARYAEHLRKYVEILQMRRDLRDSSMKANAGAQALEARHADISRQLAELEKLSVYRVIGKLLSSTVYDGSRLPKLFRVVSPEPGLGRTLAYVQPAEGLDLEGKLGRIVGVVGDARMEDSLKANLIAPKRVDVLSLAALSGSSPNIQPAPASPGSGGQ